MKKPARLVVVGSPAGGVGKSIVAKAIADIYKKYGVTAALLDAEVEQKVGGMLRSYFPEARWLDISTRGQFDEAFRICLDTGLALLDLGAATGPITKAWFKRVGPALGRFGVKCTLVAPITASQSSTAAVFDWSNELQGNVEWLIVKNEVVGTDFAFYDHTSQGKLFRERYSPREIRLMLRWDIIENELQARRLTLLQAIDAFNAGNYERLGPFLASPDAILHIEEYSEQITAELETVRDLLLP